MRMRHSRTLTLSIGALAFAVGTVTPTPVVAQTPFVPYFGKNRVHYDKFEWNIYKTDHFEIFYYPSLEPHLETVASYAESAYQRISGELKHDLADRVPLILFKTQSEFQMQNVSGEELPEGVLAFAELVREARPGGERRQRDVEVCALLFFRGQFGGLDVPMISGARGVAFARSRNLRRRFGVRADA